MDLLSTRFKRFEGDEDLNLSEWSGNGEGKKVL
jgi:hypothetical protein